MITNLKSPRYRLLQVTSVLALTLLWPRHAYGQTGRQVRDIAKSVTVLVSPQNSSGSGVLIKQEGSSYYVLTAKHVIESTRAGEEADVITADGQSHTINIQAILYLSGVDLALLRFDSDRNYPVATLGNSESLAETDTVFIAGFPLPGQAITKPTFIITKGVITGKGKHQRGYGLIYDNVTQPGMSGGPILNETGQVVGIHGLAEGERVQGVAVKAGLNLGVPINTILDLTPLALQQTPKIDAPHSVSPSETPKVTPSQRPEVPPLIPNVSLSPVGQFAAIAYSISTGKYGYGYLYASRAAAEKRALQECNQRVAAQDCQALVWFQNACGSLVQATSGAYGWAWDEQIQVSEREALKQCSSFGGTDCQISLNLCSNRVLQSK